MFFGIIVGCFGGMKIIIGCLGGMKIVIGCFGGMKIIIGCFRGMSMPRGSSRWIYMLVRLQDAAHVSTSGKEDRRG